MPDVAGARADIEFALARARDAIAYLETAANSALSALWAQKALVNSLQNALVWVDAGEDREVGPGLPIVNIIDAAPVHIGQELEFPLFLTWPTKADIEISYNWRRMDTAKWSATSVAVISAGAEEASIMVPTDASGGIVVKLTGVMHAIIGAGEARGDVLSEAWPGRVAPLQ